MQSSIVIAICACSSDKLTMVTTTETEQWVEIAGYNPDAPGIATDIVVDLDAKGQTMQGFGVTITAGKKTVTVNIPANSLSTVVL